MRCFRLQSRMRRVTIEREEGKIMSNNKYFDFDLPKQLLEMIDEYKREGTELNKDLYQDEIRSLSRYLDDEEQGEQVIDYFCREGRRP